MEVQDCGRFQHNGGAEQSGRVHQTCTQACKKSVNRPQGRCSAPWSLEDQQLMSQEHGFGDHRPDAAWLHQADDRDDQVDEEDEGIAHGLRMVVRLGILTSL
jgi:hypothetical protein